MPVNPCHWSRAARPNRLSWVLFQGADRPGRKRARRCGPLHRPRQDDRWVRLIAWPAHYGDSGVMTFIVDHDGIVHQRPRDGDCGARPGYYALRSGFQLAKGGGLTANNRQAGEAGTGPASTAPPGRAPACPCPGWTASEGHIGLSTQPLL